MMNREPSKREEKVQRLIEAARLHCKECTVKDYEKCKLCKYDRWINDEMRRIQNG